MGIIRMNLKRISWLALKIIRLYRVYLGSCFGSKIIYVEGQIRI